MMDAEQFIDAVHEYECLWNVKNSGYKDRRKRENAWKEVSNLVSLHCLEANPLSCSSY